jgi:hypothetical protein
MNIEQKLKTICLKYIFISFFSIVSLYTTFYSKSSIRKYMKIINKIEIIQNFEDIIKTTENNTETEILNLKNSNEKENIVNNQDDLTIVTAFYVIKSKRSIHEYVTRLINFMKLNHSMVFFTQKSFINIIKEMRPKHLQNKTVFIQMEIKDFYSYKNFGKEFNKTFYIDEENSYHTIPLYLIWAEKCSFLKKAILKNYFNSKCFYWVDAGYFVSKKLMKRYINWPSTKKCYENSKVLLNSIRFVNDSERKDLLNFNIDVHKKFQIQTNVGGGVFGGQPKNLLMFINYYYETIKLFISHKIFIGKDQNLFAFVAFSHPEIINLVQSGDFFYFQNYLS